MSDETETASRTAKRAAGLALIACAVAAVVLVIDQGIKRAVLEETMKARNILEEFRKLVKEAGHEPAGTPQAGEAGSGPVAGVGGGGDMVHDAAPGAVLDPAADNGRAAPGRKPAGVAGGARGDGGRTGGEGPGQVSRRVPPVPGA